MHGNWSWRRPRSPMDDKSPWRSEKLLMRHESSSTTHKQSAEVPKGTVQSLRPQTVKIWKTKITTLIIWFLHKAELTIMNLFVQNKQPTKHYTLPPINPTPLLYLRVTWMHNLQGGQEVTVHPENTHLRLNISLQCTAQHAVQCKMVGWQQCAR